MQPAQENGKIYYLCACIQNPFGLGKIETMSQNICLTSARVKIWFVSIN